MDIERYENFIREIERIIMNLIIKRTNETRIKLIEECNRRILERKKLPWHKKIFASKNKLAMMEIPKGILVPSSNLDSFIINVGEDSLLIADLETFPSGNQLHDKMKDCIQDMRNKFWEILNLYSGEINSYFEEDENKKFLASILDYISEYVRSVIDDIAKESEDRNKSIILELIDSLTGSVAKEANKENKVIMIKVIEDLTNANPLNFYTKDINVKIDGIEAVLPKMEELKKSIDKYFYDIGGLCGSLGFIRKDGVTDPNLSILLSHNDEYYVAVSCGDDSIMVVPNKNEELRKIRGLSTLYVDYIVDQRNADWLISCVFIGCVDIAKKLIKG